MVNRLADQQDRSSIFGRLPSQQVNRKRKTVEDSRSAIPLTQSMNSVSHHIQVGSEILNQPRRPVEAHHGNLVRDIAHDCLKRRHEKVGCAVKAGDGEGDAVCPIANGADASAMTTLNFDSKVPKLIPVGSALRCVRRGKTRLYRWFLLRGSSKPPTR